MGSLERRIAVVTETTATLVAQLRELDRLRENLREARLSAKKTPRRKRRNGDRTIKRVSPELILREPSPACGGSPKSIAPSP